MLEDNAKAILEYFDGRYEHVSFLKQVHSACCAEIASGADIDYSKEADAQVTQNSKIILAVRTADCVPILLADPLHRLVGVAHAGWKGALGGVIDSVVRAMQRAGAKRQYIKAIIGPCIRQDSYEVGEDLVARFMLESVNNSKFFKHSPFDQNKRFFDLPGYVVQLLRSSGVQHVEDTGIDTFKNFDFFSYRRATKAGERLPWRNLSFIALKG